jgi:hypothetical protein
MIIPPGDTLPIHHQIYHEDIQETSPKSENALDIFNLALYTYLTGGQA